MQKTYRKCASAHAEVDWNDDEQTATLDYNAGKMFLNALLKRIAGSGYDNEKYLAAKDNSWFL